MFCRLWYNILSVTNYVKYIFGICRISVCIFWACIDYVNLFFGNAWNMNIYFPGMPGTYVFVFRACLEYMYLFSRHAWDKCIYFPGKPGISVFIFQACQENRLIYWHRSSGTYRKQYKVPDSWQYNRICPGRFMKVYIYIGKYIWKKKIFLLLINSK